MSLNRKYNLFFIVQAEEGTKILSNNFLIAEIDTKALNPDRHR